MEIGRELAKVPSSSQAHARGLSQKLHIGQRQHYGADEGAAVPERRNRDPHFLAVREAIERALHPFDRDGLAAGRPIRGHKNLGASHTQYAVRLSSRSRPDGLANKRQEMRASFSRTI